MMLSRPLCGSEATRTWKSPSSKERKGKGYIAVPSSKQPGVTQQLHRYRESFVSGLRPEWCFAALTIKLRRDIDQDRGSSKLTCKYIRRGGEIGKWKSLWRCFVGSYAVCFGTRYPPQSPKPTEGFACLLAPGVRPCTDPSAPVFRDTGNFETDQAAAEGLVRTFLKSKGHQKVAADRGAKKLAQELRLYINCPHPPVSCCACAPSFQLEFSLEHSLLMLLEPGGSLLHMLCCQDDTLIMDMKITDAAGYTPLPGLSGERIAFDPDEDPLGLAPVRGGGECAGVGLRV
eukprot:1157850-Pelagomonas_calceolata.AAC.17